MAGIPPTSKHRLPPMAAGQRYGRLIAIEFVERDQRSSAWWRFHCDCGQTIVVRSDHVRGGRTKSCGCLNLEQMAAQARVRNTTHGMYYTPEYSSWVAMKRRCSDPQELNFERYGGCGIKVCERWQESFENFYADMGPKPSPQHSIDRIDNEGNYEPSNCRWATRSQQMRNKRKNHMVTYEGEQMTLVEACERTGISYGVVRTRLYRGWSLERALTR
jgi:hypothetical protein